MVGVNSGENHKFVHKMNFLILAQITALVWFGHNRLLVGILWEGWPGESTLPPQAPAEAD